MILVTGATGFVGRTLISNLLTNAYQVNALVRQESKDLAPEVDQIIGDLQSLGLDEHSSTVSFTEDNSVLKAKLEDVNVIIHCAARVHIMDDLSEDPLEKFRVVNTYATLNLAKAGVKRFVFLSSIKVNGEI